LKENSEDGLA